VKVVTHLVGDALEGEAGKNSHFETLLSELGLTGAD